MTGLSAVIPAVAGSSRGRKTAAHRIATCGGNHGGHEPQRSAGRPGVADARHTPVSARRTGATATGPRNEDPWRCDVLGLLSLLCLGWLGLTVLGAVSADLFWLRVLGLALLLLTGAAALAVHHPARSSTRRGPVGHARP